MSLKPRWHWPDSYYFCFIFRRRHKKIDWSSFQKQKCYCSSAEGIKEKEKTVSRKKLGRLAHQANFLDEWLPFFHQLSQNMMIATKLQAAITKQHNSIKTSFLLFLLSSFSKVGNGGFLVDFYIVLSFFNADQNDVFCDSQKTRPSVFLVKTRLRITKGSEQEW